MENKNEMTRYDIKQTPLLKSTAEIARTASTRQIKLIELIECCKVAEASLKGLYSKVKILKSSKNDCEEMLSDYKMRNKVNSFNSQSLIQAKCQLNKCKCELKSEYVMLQKSIKQKKAKFEKTISLYEAAWTKALEQYNTDPLVKKLREIQKENELLEKEISRMKQVIPESIKQLSELEKSIESKLREKLIEFSEQMIRYRQFLEAERKKRESELLNAKNSNEKNRQISIFGPKHSITTDKTEKQREETLSLPDEVLGIDDLMDPIENLESQHEDDFIDELMMLDNDGKKHNMQPENSCLERTNIDPQDLIPEKKSKNEEKSEVLEKFLDVSETESQYFNQFIQQGETTEVNFEKNVPIKTLNNSNKKNEEKTQKKQTISESLAKTEIRENKSEKRIISDNAGHNIEEKMDKQDRQRVQAEPEDKFDFHYRATPMNNSKEGFAPFFDLNHNESSGSLISNQNLKSEDDREAYKSFKGFFTMGSDRNSPTPSIFKLF